ncbi:hypothetical protein WUBG_17832, partial [Wuchereria bancrofti]
KNDRGRKVSVEATERIVRQLEAMGKNLKQSNIEIRIENKLLAWIWERIYQQKEEQEMWSVAKLKQFLAKPILRNEIARSQSLSIVKEQRITKNKFIYTSTLAMTTPPA